MMNTSPKANTKANERILASAPGHYPWDHWQREAHAAGLSPELAALGRAVMRESYQHDWCDRLKYECGIDNPGTAAGMITCGKDHPYLAERRWQWLLITDGLRFDPWKHEEFREASPEWNEMRRRWQAESVHGKAPHTENQLLFEAVDYITFFYKLNQLAIIDLLLHAVSQKDGTTTLWADFTVIGTISHSRVDHSGIVRVELDEAGACVDAAIFERTEES
jgi:hypothetical protein